MSPNNPSSSGLTALVPARGGSKRIPRKNIQLFGEHPLIAHSIRAAQAASYVGQVYVLTDDAEIADVARSYGATIPYLRAPQTSSDVASSESVIDEFIDALNPEGDFIFLQPTSPLRTAWHIDQAYADYCQRAGGALISVTDYIEGDAYPVFVDPNKQIYRSIKKGANAALNGAIYITSFASWRKTHSFWGEQTYAFFMDKSVSVDIDRPEDFQQALNLHLSRQETE